ncbi:hypothetical protein [Ilumatobacter sp.]|uniref:hypothetical protein n=1 Tax=Ilumatobacter sp. TaxID=1967498 RepID=UPI003C5CCC18
MNDQSPDRVERNNEDGARRRSTSGPTHPVLPATLLMIGVVLLIVLASAISVVNR